MPTIAELRAETVAALNDVRTLRENVDRLTEQVCEPLIRDLEIRVQTLYDAVVHTDA